jgi:hypothetical protein
VGWARLISRSAAAAAVAPLFSACELTVDLAHLADGPGALADAGGDRYAPADAAGAIGDAAAPPGDAADTAATLGLVGYWKLDDSSGTTARDSSGMGNDGKLVNGPTWEPAQGGTPPALRFDGVDDRVNVLGGMTYATQHAAFSFSAWFNLLDWGSGYPDIMQMRTDTESPWHVLLSTHGPFMGISVGSCGTWVPLKTDKPVVTGTFHHVAVTYSGQDATAISSFKLYLDGVSTPLVAAGGYGCQSQQSSIGASDTDNQFNGLIHDIRIYNRALDAADIATLFASGQ